MDDKKRPLTEGYQPEELLQKGYQPSPKEQPKTGTGEDFEGGYQPPTTENKPKLPPKKP